MSEFLFVYGTLKRNSRHPMRAVLAGGGDWLGPAVMSGLLYDLGPYPGLVPDHEQRRCVRGDLYRIHDPGTLLAVLDEFEDCTPAAVFPEYRRELRWAHPDRGQPTLAWVYLYNRSVTGRAPLPSGDYPGRSNIHGGGSFT